MIHYYLSISPMEALIASELSPEAFGAYMATGARKGAAEQLIFIEIEPDFGEAFDWAYAREHCVPHEDGRPKQSLYLGIYRVLERIPVKRLGALYLVTRDGRGLELEKRELRPVRDWKGVALYKELCPVMPLVASSLPPREFADFLTSDARKVSVPAIIFADIRMLDIDDLKNSGHVGTISQRELEHIQGCVEEVRGVPGKKTKTVDRSFISRFTYQTIANGIYASDGKEIACYPMPEREFLIKKHYDWCRSANLC